jgi:hypothetical protein
MSLPEQIQLYLLYRLDGFIVKELFFNKKTPNPKIRFGVQNIISM